MELKCRAAEAKDVEAITRIYNQGIEDRVATLETRLRSGEEMLQWLEGRSPRHKVIIIEDDVTGVVGWASLNVFNSRCCYDGVVDISVYVEREMRGKGIGKRLLSHLTAVAAEEGFHKLVLSTFSTNQLGQGLYTAVGFRKVGTYEKQGLLDGKWVDVTIMEKLLV